QTTNTRTTKFKHISFHKFPSFSCCHFPDFLCLIEFLFKNKKQAEYSDLFYNLSYDKWKHSIILKNNDRLHTLHMQSNEILSANRTPFRQSPLSLIIICSFT